MTIMFLIKIKYLLKYFGKLLLKYEYIKSAQCRSKGNISGGGGARKCWRREPLGGLGACSPRKI